MSAPIHVDMSDSVVLGQACIAALVYITHNRVNIIRPLHSRGRGEGRFYDSLMKESPCRCWKGRGSLPSMMVITMQGCEDYGKYSPYKHRTQLHQRQLLPLAYDLWQDVYAGGIQEGAYTAK